MTTEHPSIPALLILPRLRIQGANAISSPLTWGFPSITAFTGLMTALERRLGPEAGIAMHKVGVICHAIEPQVTNHGYTRNFHLTRNPVLPDGSTAAIVEEGRTHLDLTLVFDVELAPSLLGDTEQKALAEKIGDILAGMRVAGGSVVPPLPDACRRPPTPQLIVKQSEPKEAVRQLRRLSRHWLPGFALVSRDDLLQHKLDELRSARPDASLLDALLDLSSLTHRAIREDAASVTDKQMDKVTWRTDTRPGWIVPIPVGFARIGALQEPGTVAGARDPAIKFAFVESVYSMGQWISPHRLSHIDHLFWKTVHDSDSGLYRCINDFPGASSHAVPSH